MIKPIVSMNRMSMNESVAATCCYRELALSDKVIWEVLNGGWIGTGYATLDGFKSGFEFIKDSTWNTYGYDVTNDGGSDALAGLMNSYFPVLSTNTTGESVWTLDGVPIDALTIAENGLRRGSVCSHTDGNCIYRVSDNTLVNNYHFESTMKHDTSGKDWTLPHPSMKFSS